MNAIEEDASHQPQIEEERRFLVRDVSVVIGAQWELITQAYYVESEGSTLRLRLTQEPNNLDPERATHYRDKKLDVGMKGPRSGGRRREDEAELKDFELAKYLLGVAPNVVRKRRYSVLSNFETWVVDEFLEDNSGLYIAELEGKGGGIWDAQVPEWTAREITYEEEFNNEILAFYPMRGRYSPDSNYRKWAAQRGKEHTFQDDPDF